MPRVFVEVLFFLLPKLVLAFLDARGSAGHAGAASAIAPFLPRCAVDRSARALSRRPSSAGQQAGEHGTMVGVRASGRVYMPGLADLPSGQAGLLNENVVKPP